MKKILWVKFGWSDYYRGGPVNGNFSWLTGEGNKGHEAFNFEPSTDGTYYCYVPPHYVPLRDDRYAPYNRKDSDQTGWTVICLAKHKDYKGIHIVGWYENATLLGEWLKAPEDRLYLSVTGTNPSYEWLYCITSKTAYFVPPEHRTSSFSHPSIGQGKYSFLAGPKVKQNKNKAHVLKVLQNKLTKLNSIAVKNPTAASAPDLEADPVDPLHGFGTPEHRKKVEKAAEIAVIKYYAAKGFTYKDVTTKNFGYDFIFAKGKDEHHVEVKGTAGNVSRFFMTRNEDAYRENRTWRFAIVTNALTSEPIVQVLNNREFNAEFELVPFVYRGVRKIKPVKI